jgi:hypothetical protein
MKGFIAFIVAVILGLILLPISFIYSFLVYLFQNKLYYFFLNNAITIDILGNVNGELIERLVTKERNTLFGSQGVTISASLGDLELRNKLNKKGLFLSKILNFAFNQKQHCIDAYYNLIKK